MRRPKPSTLVRFAWRVTLTAVICAALVFGSLEFAQRIGQNLALASELSHAQRDIAALQAHRAEQAREIRRLQHDEGAVPYIYSRLRMVRPGQTLVYIVAAPTPTP